MSTLITFFFFNDLFLYLVIDTVFHPSENFQNEVCVHGVVALGGYFVILCQELDF